MPVRLKPRPAYAPFEVAAGTTLLAALVRAGIPIGRACRGAGVCRSCRLRVIAGHQLLTQPTAQEVRWRLAPDERLACEARIEADDGTIEVTTPGWGTVPPEPRR